MTSFQVISSCSSAKNSLENDLTIQNPGDQDASIEADDHHPAEFLPFAQDPSSLTHRTALAMGVDPHDFINWRWHMANQLADSGSFSDLVGVSTDERDGLDDLKELFRAGVTPYYAGLIRELGDQSGPVRLQAIPRIQEAFDDLGQKDPLSEVDHSPVREVVHLYPDRVAFCVAMLCPVYCRYCYRKRRDEDEGLHYNRSIVARGIAYIAATPAIRDVLITGGDPFIASDDAIIKLVRKLRAIPHVEIIRFGTRTPVTLPYRVSRTLCQRLAEFHPIWVNTHFNCAEELTPETAVALDNLVSAGIPVGNQSVLLRGVNDSVERMSDLCRALVRHRVRPYYVFHPHLVAGTQHLRVDLRRGLAIMRAMRGNISGYAIPQYILDTPSGKVPLGNNHILDFDGEDVLVEDVRGEIWREIGVTREDSDGS